MAISLSKVLTKMVSTRNKFDFFHMCTYFMGKNHHMAISLQKVLDVGNKNKNWNWFVLRVSIRRKRNEENIDVRTRLCIYCF